MSHGNFLYLVSEREGARRARVQEAVADPQLAQVGHDEAVRAGALWDEEDRGACLNIQEDPRSSLRTLSNLTETEETGR